MSISRNLLPPKWQTERFQIEDGTWDDVEALQKIYDVVPQTGGWSEVEGGDELQNPILFALKNGLLPPNGSKEFFRLQSIRMVDSAELIGFLSVYHGFPEMDIFWIHALTLHPNCQGMGYGPELIVGLFNIVGQLASYHQIQTFVSLKNWPSLRLCGKVGFSKIIKVVGDKVFAENADAHILLAKIVGE